MNYQKGNKYNISELPFIIHVAPSRLHRVNFYIISRIIDKISFYYFRWDALKYYYSGDSNSVKDSILFMTDSIQFRY